MNKTEKYLLRCLLLVDDKQNLLKFMTDNVTVGSMHGVKQGIFLCYNFRQLDNSKEILEFARSRSYYIDDYLVGHPIYGDCHMIQLKPHARAYSKFLQSKFSKMYTLEELKKIAKKDAPHWKVLTNDDNYRNELAKKYNINVEQIIECDELINPAEEFFDYPIIDPLEFRNRQNDGN